ncbi:MAG: hypothetical protein J0I26_09640 [Alphaproteobacteria bacterium]|nr:hypothetical protein [Alphaproteobacteria bacterium]
MMSPRLLLAALIGVAVLVVIGANAHLVYVSTTSQPACVTHVKSGGGAAAPGVYSAANSAC